MQKKPCYRRLYEADLIPTSTCFSDVFVLADLSLTSGITAKNGQK